MVELRKRKTESTQSSTQPLKKVLTNPKAIFNAKEPAAPSKTPTTAPKAQSTAQSKAQLKAGDTLDVSATFPEKILLSDGQDTHLDKLLQLSVSGVVLFTYPKANTPGCTNQACAFRDANTELHSLGYAVYGLSRDSVKSNASFKTKQNLPFTLICDQQGKVIDGLGFGKAGGKTTRGVIVIKKDGKILEHFSGGPMATLEAVWPVVRAAETGEPMEKTTTAEGVVGKAGAGATEGVKA